jgi:hypothetical protein
MQQLFATLRGFLASFSSNPNNLSKETNNLIDTMMMIYGLEGKILGRAIGEILTYQ